MSFISFSKERGFTSEEIMGHVLLIIILMCLSIIASPSSGAKSQKNVWSPKKSLFYKIIRFQYVFLMLEKIIIGI